MSVAKVEKVNILFDRDDKEIVIDRLQDFGFVQILDTSSCGNLSELDSIDVSQELSKTDYILAGVKFCIDYLSPFEEKHGSALDRMISGKPGFSRSHIERRVSEIKHEDIVRDVQELEASFNKVDNELAMISSERLVIMPWRLVPFVLNHDKMPHGFDYILAVGASGVLDQIKRVLEEEGIAFEASVVSGNGKNEFFYCISPRIFFDKTQRIITSAGGEIVEVDGMQEYVRERLLQIDTNEQKLYKSREELVFRAGELARHIPDLKMVYDYYAWERGRLEAISRAGQTDRVNVLTGWIEVLKIPELEKALSGITPRAAVVPAHKSDSEEPPVIMRNSKWARPFEAITGIYGSPSYNEPDPTPWLAPFFVVFFGLSLTDVGYGVFLAVLSALGLKFMAHTDEAKKLMKVMIVGGVSTAVLGALFGGWMGVSIDNLAPWVLRDFLVGIRLIDPIANPISVLILSFILGIFQVMVGLFINIKWQFSHGDKKEAVWGSGVWLVFLIVVVLWVLGKIGIFPKSSLGLLTPLAFGAMGLVILAGTRKTKNWFLKLPIGILGLYDLVGYFSDVLSYSRLLALGLGTGIIAMVVNLIARLAVDMVPVVGWVFFVLILIGGHLFNIAINVLGAYIHSSRLQFVEFFPKFMEGGGKSFVPFRKESKYIRLKDLR